tara:strand:+ start:1513 stop:2460 length:948 start_codon:yes stop_codon:yes gene_type:complete
MLFRLFSLSSVFVSLFFLGACSDAPSKPTAAVKRDVTVAKAVLKTSGILRFDGLPGESISAAEVLVVSVLSDVARERILRQRELFENKITGRVEDLAGVSSIEGMSPVDAMKLEASLGALRSQFPSVRVEDVDLGNNRLRKYQSDVALFKEYEYLFASIEWDNVERGLEFIADKMTADSKALVARSSGMDDDALQQSDVTLDWLRAVQQHYNSYVVLAQESVEAKNRYLHAQAAVASTPAEPTDWDGYVAWHAHNLIMDISENLLGTAFAEEDGSFEVEGQGIVIVRVELGTVSAYFLPGSEHEKRVLVEDLQQF